MKKKNANIICSIKISQNSNQIFAGIKRNVRRAIQNDRNDTKSETTEYSATANGKRMINISIFNFRPILIAQILCGMLVSKRNRNGFISINKSFIRLAVQYGTELADMT